MRLADPLGFLLAGLARLITGAQGHWKGCPPKAEQRIYFANHQSHLDWVLIWAVLPADLRATTRPIAAKDYWTKTPLKHWITREIFHAVYVERDGRASGVDPLAPLVEALQRGDSLVIFPEGTRGFEPLPQRFKSGLYHLARQFPHVQLIPAWIDNVQRVMPKGEVVPVPVLCTVTFGAPCDLRPDEPKADFLARARDAVIACRPGNREGGTRQGDQAIAMPPQGEPETPAPAATTVARVEPTLDPVAAAEDGPGSAALGDETTSPPSTLPATATTQAHPAPALAPAPTPAPAPAQTQTQLQSQSQTQLQSQSQSQSQSQANTPLPLPAPAPEPPPTRLPSPPHTLPLFPPDEVAPEARPDDDTGAAS